MDLINKIKERWPLRAMLVHCGIPYLEKGKFSSPFREDKNPSCEIYKESLHDWGTGQYFDSIAVFAEHKGITNVEAIRQLARELPGHSAKSDKDSRGLEIPLLDCSFNDIYTLADVRGLSMIGVEMATSYLGTLGFGLCHGFDCWILSDSGRVAEARRLDGINFPSLGSLGERKSHTLKGSKKSWPIGINPPLVKILPLSLPVVLVEGGPDYLAACDLLAAVDKDFLPVAMLGSSNPIHEDALPFFQGRKVIILAHPDDAGLEASLRWKEQLKRVGAKEVRVLQLRDGDLNDLIRIHGASAISKALGL